MRPLAYTLFSVVAFFAAASTRPGELASDVPSTSVSAAPVEAAVVASEILQRLDSAWNAADSGKFAAEFSDDADLINIFGMHISGRAEIQKRIRSIFDTIYKGSAHRSRKLEKARYLSLDTILALSSNEITVPDGPLAPVSKNRQTFVLTKNGDTWQIRHWHNTAIRDQEQKMK